MCTLVYVFLQGVRRVYWGLDVCTGGPSYLEGFNMCTGRSTCQPGGSTRVLGSLTCVTGGSTSESDVNRGSVCASGV